MKFGGFGLKLRNGKILVTDLSSQFSIDVTSLLVCHITDVIGEI